MLNVFDYMYVLQYNTVLQTYMLTYMSRDMRFPTMWYVRLANAQTSLRTRAD